MVACCGDVYPESPPTPTCLNANGRGNKWPHRYMNTQYLPAAGPGDDEDEDAKIRPVDHAEYEHADEDWAITDGAGALVE